MKKKLLCNTNKLYRKPKAVNPESNALSRVYARIKTNNSLSWVGFSRRGAQAKDSCARDLMGLCSQEKESERSRKGDGEGAWKDAVSA